MMARYIKERGYKGEGKDPNMTMLKIYIVHGITFRPDSKNYPQMLWVRSGTDNYPSGYDIQFFEFVDERIPPDWIFRDQENGYYCLEPQEFAGDFWDKFHDGDPASEAIFETVMEKLNQFHAA